MDKNTVMRIRVLQTVKTPVDEIAAKVGLSVFEVANKLTELGYKPVYKEHFSEAELNYIKAMYSGGYSEAYIANSLEVPTAMIRKILVKIKEESAPAATDANSKNKDKLFQFNNTISCEVCQDPEQKIIEDPGGASCTNSWDE